MECQDRGELFALWTALGNITMEQSGSILVGSTPISDVNADGVGDCTIPTEDEVKVSLDKKIQAVSLTDGCLGNQHKQNKGKRDFLFPLFVNIIWLY